jgi:hypothetical protein
VTWRGGGERESGTAKFAMVILLSWFSLTCWESHFSSQVGVRAGGKEKYTHLDLNNLDSRFKGTKENESRGKFPGQKEKPHTTVNFFI